MIDKYQDKRHKIPVILDYRVAHTVLGGFKMSLKTANIVNPEVEKWLKHFEDMLDKGVQKEWDGKCRRNGEDENEKNNSNNIDG